MSVATTIGIDLAKNSFHVYGINEHGAKVFSRILTRGKVTEFFATIPNVLWAWKPAPVPAIGSGSLKDMGTR